MRISRAEAENLTARRARKAVDAPCPVREGWDSGALTVFVPGRPWNPLNGPQRSYMKHARLRKAWRERTADALFRVGYEWKTREDAWQTRENRRWPWEPSEPKRVRFTVYAFNAFDGDNLEAVCKSVRDALKDCGIVDDDRPSAGHAFEYAQVVTRAAGAAHGIAVRIVTWTPRARSIS